MNDKEKLIEMLIRIKNDIDISENSIIDYSSSTMYQFDENGILTYNHNI